MLKNRKSKANCNCLPFFCWNKIHSISGVLAGSAHIGKFRPIRSGSRPSPQVYFAKTTPSSPDLYRNAPASSSSSSPLTSLPQSSLPSPQKFPISSIDFAPTASSSALASSAAVDSDHLRLLVARGGMDRSKRSAGVVASLPDDPLVEILSRVPVKSVRRFKCVSKAWRDLIADPLHRKKLPQTLEGFFFYGRCGDDRVSGYGDSENCGSKDWPRFDGHFIDVLGRPLLDPCFCFSFLTELPGNENIRFLHSCNGLVLFGRSRDSETSVSYIVCNPAIEQWVAVPTSGRTSSQLTRYTLTYLTFDPATDSCFHLVQFWTEAYDMTLHTYSSKTGVWIHKNSDHPDWDYYGIRPIQPNPHNVYVNGMLHLILDLVGEDQLVSVDVEGNIQKIISPPVPAGTRELCQTVHSYLGESQGRLHYICLKFEIDLKDRWVNELLIWVLEDYDTQQWVLKDTVSFLKLFGENGYKMGSNYYVVAIHPDHNLVYLVRHRNQKLISYNMDSKQVRDVSTLEHDYRYITPYVPYFSEV